MYSTTIGQSHKMSNLRRRQAVVVDDPNERTDLLKSLNDPENAYIIALQLHLKKPVSLNQLFAETHFTRKEIKSIYRAFKETSPTAIIHRDIVRNLFTTFFKGDTEHFADLIFDTFDADNSGTITFDKFVKTLSVICRGSIEEKLMWLYSLYDPQQTGYVSWHRLLYIITAMDDLVGIEVRPRLTREQRIRQANYVFNKFDPTQSGLITKQQFIDLCKSDENIADFIMGLTFNTSKA
ncbi:EF-hand domain pair domain-containing protein [Ditylenchus destructor]|nr:EF-hand domain pair domain-containing protein [Ditylenchus destructor]